MKIKKYNFYNSEKDILEEIDIYGFCEYCKFPVLVIEVYKKKNGKVYHLDCWKQKHL